MSCIEKIFGFRKRAKEAALKRENERIKMINKITENDEIANKTEWSSYKKGGANFKTVVLNQKENGDMEIKPSRWLYFAVYVGSFVMSIHLAIPIAQKFGAGYFVLPIIIGPVVACVILKNMNRKYFDSSIGKYYIGKYATSKCVVDFADVYALQIIRKKCYYRNNRYYSYEINMVLNTGNRYNIMDHGNLNKIKENAQTIADILGVKLWDLSDV